ncbi:hypothetical protein ACHAWX_006420 [Stephanocyclus meneghinianus]
MVAEGEAFSARRREDAARSSTEARSLKSQSRHSTLVSVFWEIWRHSALTASRASSSRPLRMSKAGWHDERACARERPRPRDAPVNFKSVLIILAAFGTHRLFGEGIDGCRDTLAAAAQGSGSEL